MKVGCLAAQTNVCTLLSVAIYLFIPMDHACFLHLSLVRGRGATIRVRLQKCCPEKLRTQAFFIVPVKEVARFRLGKRVKR